jgi:hypothetical protein
MSWREKAKPIIAKVLLETKDSTPRERRKALVIAYPFGQRKFWPYKVWLNEIRRQRDGWSPPVKKRYVNEDRLGLFPPQMTIAEVYGEIEIK